jgi:putative endonuclease
MKNTRCTGNEYETQAVAYLENKGYKILDRNYTVRQGEIDIVARDEKYLVFCEVKYRAGNGSGYPEEAVNYRKQRQISKVALYYINHKRIPPDEPIRFDVISISQNEIRHMKNAFDFIG